MRGLLLLLIFAAHFSYSNGMQEVSNSICKVQLNTTNNSHHKRVYFFNGNVSREEYETSGVARHLFDRVGTVKLQLCDPYISGNRAALGSFFQRHVNAHARYVGTIFFDTGIDAISSLDSLRLRQLLKDQTYQAMIFVGRADSTGESRFNQDLSYRRAANVQKVLGYDVAGALIALGDRQTVQEKADVNRNNRRVDIYVFSYPGTFSR